MSAEDSRSSLALLVTLGVVWGSAFIAIRFVLDQGASPAFFVLVRMAAAAPLMALLALIAGHERPSGRDLLVSAALGGVFVMGGYQVLLFWGEQFTSGGLAGILVAASPLFTAVLSVVLLPHEAFGRTGIAGLALGFAGVALLFEPDLARGSGGTVWGLLAVLVAALAFAIGSVLLRRWRRGGESYWGASVEFAAGALFALPFAIFLDPHPDLPIGPLDLLAIGYLVGAASVLGFAAYFTLHHRIGPGQANLVSFVSPISAVVFGVVLLGESYAWIQLGGFALIVLGLALLQRDRTRSTPPERGNHGNPTSPVDPSPRAR